MASETFVDLTALAARSGRTVWAHQSEDLNINLLVLMNEEGVAAHVNSAVDVLIIGIEGEGVVGVDGVEHIVTGGCALIVPKGANRAIQGKSSRFAYLTCHRRQPELHP